jgi:predicted PurR-regulated permease PerM
MLVVVLPLVVALLLATLFAPPARALERRGWHPGVAALATVGSGLVVVVAALSLIIPSFIAELGNLGSTVEQGVRQLGASLARGPLGLTTDQIDRSIDRAVSDIGGSGGQVAQGVITGALLATQWATSALLAIFLTFFFVKDGVRMWAWTTSLAGAARRPVFHDLGVRTWSVLTAYVHGVALVATVDAVLIGVVLLALGVPLALPLIVLTFIAAFFPIVGALVAGAAAVLVALVTNGVAAAVIVLAAIIFIQQLEGNVLYPVVVGRQLNLHPVAMLLALAIGAVVAGVAGAFLAVPVAAVIGAGINYARSAERIGHSGPLTADELVARPSG